MASGRDNALPWGRTFAHLHPRWNTPVYAILLTAGLQVCIGAIYVGNATAYYGIAGSTVTMQVLSYLAPILLHVWNHKKLDVKYGPWTLGRFRWPLTATATLIYGTLFVTMSLPVLRPVTAVNM